MGFFVENDIILRDDESYPAMHGDAIFHQILVVTSRIEGIQEDIGEDLLNKRMNYSQIAIEYSYSVLDEYFSLFNVKKIKPHQNRKEMHVLVLMAMFLKKIYFYYDRNKIATEHRAIKLDINFYLPIDEQLDIA